MRRLIVGLVVVLPVAVMLLGVNDAASDELRFTSGSVFVGTLDYGSNNNEIYEIHSDGTVSTFANNITGGIRALAVNPLQQSLYALTVQKGGSRQIVSFSSDGTRQLYADLGLIVAPGETDLEISRDRMFLTTASDNLVEIFSDGTALTRFEGTGDVYQALEFDEAGNAFLGERGGDVIRLDADFANPTLFAHVPFSDHNRDFAALEFDPLGNLITMAHSSDGLNRIDDTGVVTLFSDRFDQSGKLAIDTINSEVFAVGVHTVDVFDLNGTHLRSIGFSRQLDGIVAIGQTIPTPSSLAALIGMGLMGLIAAARQRWRKA